MIFGGIQNMDRLPSAVFVADSHDNALAVSEARRMKILSIGIVDTNVNPSTVDYPIPGNDDAVTSVELILKKVSEAILKNKKGKVAHSPVAGLKTVAEKVKKAVTKPQNAKSPKK